MLSSSRDLHFKSDVAGEVSCSTKSDVRPLKALFSYVSGICCTRTARDYTARCKCSRYFYMTLPTTSSTHTVNCPPPKCSAARNQFYSLTVAELAPVFIYLIIRTVVLFI